MKFFPEKICQFLPGYSQLFSGNQDFGHVSGITEGRIHLNLSQIPAFFIKKRKVFVKSIKQMFSFGFQQPETFFHGGHEKIRRGTGLIEPQKPADLSFRNPVGLNMKKGGLGKSGKCLMKALDDQICSQRQGGSRKPAAERKMCAVGFVYDERDAMAVGNGGNTFQVADNAVVSRRYHQNGVKIRVL